MNKNFFDLKRIRGIADYQFSSKIGNKFFPDGVGISYSKSTGRIKHIYLNKALLATLRPTNGMFSLTIAGARRIIPLIDYPKLRVIVQKEIENFIMDGRNVFAPHVIMADEEIRPGEEVIVTNNKDEVLAVGKSLLTGREMLAFNRGVAVKVRRGIGEKKLRKIRH